MIQYDIGAAAGARSSCLFIGRDRSGRWVLKDARSLCGGLLTNRTEAIRVCDVLNANAALNPSLCCLMVSYSTDRSTKTMRAIRRSGARRREDCDRPFEETSKAGRFRDRPRPAGGYRRWRLCRPMRTTRAAYWRSSALEASDRGRAWAAGDVKAAFLVQNMGSPADFEAALQHAASEGWLYALARPHPADHGRVGTKCRRSRGRSGEQIRSHPARASCDIEHSSLAGTSSRFGREYRSVALRSNEIGAAQKDWQTTHKTLIYFAMIS